MVQCGYAQINPSPSNLRRKYIPAQKDTVQLDSLSIIPNSFSIPGVDQSAYSLDQYNAKLIWKKKPKSDSVWAFYRVFPGKFSTTYQRLKFDSIQNNFLAAPVTINYGNEVQNTIFDFGNVNYNGSFGRALSFGNRQDVVVNSSLNLQMNGYLGDSIMVSAAITDNNIPIQPDGNTQNLNEFDKVFIQFKKNGWHFDIGDIDIRQQQSFFLNFYSRLQGAEFEQQTKIGQNGSNDLLVSGAVAKGKYTRNIFQGIEGNQGPYRLTGANNELFFIVLANTERVYIDGELMQRGEDQDYVINYNTAEITFTPKRMITKDKRIQVEFGYADRNFLNSQLYAMDELRLNKRLKFRVAAYSNVDAKNSPINQPLDTKQRQFLADVGDSVQNAYYPSATLDTFSVTKILYKKIDTLINGSFHDSIYVYSTDPDNAKYNLGFTDVGIGKGNYVPDETSAANGKVYRWVSPDTNGNRLGQFEAKILLIAPKKQQLVSIGAEYALSKTTVVSTEMALSNYDINTLSTKDKSDNTGFAGRMLVTDTRPMKNSKKGYQLQTNLGYEWVQQTFRPVERLRSVEFYRDWGLPLNASYATENLFYGGFNIKNKGTQSLAYQFASYNRSDDYNGIRNSILHSANFSSWRINDQFNLTNFNQQSQKGYYFKPVVDIARTFKKLGNYILGGGFSLEENYLKYRQFDSLNTASFSFTIWQAYLKSPDNKPNKWGVTYYARNDKYPYLGKLTKSDRSNNVTMYTDLMKNPKHQLRLSATYRKLTVLDTLVTNQKPDESVLGRAEYFINEFKGLLNGNVLYEVGTGQEQKRDFTYLEVPAGQGEYTWIDYNGDGIPQLNEFEIAKFQDQAKYVRVFTPTNEFIRANYLQFNYSLNINPRASINISKANSFQKFLARLYFQSSLQIFKKEKSNELVNFNPFSNTIADTSIITLSQIFSNSFSFNRYSNVWGLDFNNVRSSAKAFLTYGYESHKLDDWTMKARANITRNLLLELSNKFGVNALSTPSFANRNYNVKYYSIMPQLVFTKGTNLRAALGYEYDNKRNTDSIQTATINSINVELKYNVLSNSSITAKFTYSNINYVDPPANAANSTVSYIMLDALLPGKNYLWTLDFTKRLTSFLELNFQYEGRKAGQSGTVHIGRAALRALF
ncbi:MAG: hypothetical protein C5B52_10375 [Bacteroidetes bacterium]|nr:MAG: hypothetical protein C5B52_10375 [Bacteroidota bacterium]